MAKKETQKVSAADATRILDLKKEMMNLRFQNASGQLKNTSAIRKTRKLIAQIKTAQSKGAK